jgi:hypothetical protein
MMTSLEINHVISLTCSGGDEDLPDVCFNMIEDILGTRSPANPLKEICSSESSLTVPSLQARENSSSAWCEGGKQNEVGEHVLKCDFR